MGSKSRRDHDKHREDYLKTLGMNMITTANSTETALSYMMRAESDKIHELLKRNASTEDLLESGKIFCNILSNMAIMQLIPLLKNNAESPAQSNIKENENQNKESNVISPIVVDNLAGTAKTTKTDEINDEEENFIQYIDDSADNISNKDNDKINLDNHSHNNIDMPDNSQQVTSIMMILSQIMSVFDTAKDNANVSEEITESDNPDDLEKPDDNDSEIIGA